MATRTIPNDQAVPAFVIKEVTGKHRNVRLTARALPLRPYTLEGEQQVEVTYYPGNPVGTSTILGAREGTASINGYWKDKFIQDAVTVTNAAPSVGAGARAATVDNIRINTVEALVDLFDDIRRSGAMLEVVWGSRLRRGHMVKFTQTWHNVNDCEWTAEFKWVSRGQPSVSPIVRDDDSSAMSQRLSQNWADLERDVENIPTSTRGDWYEKALEYTSLIGYGASQFESIVSQTYQQAVQPFDGIRASLSNITGVIANGSAVLDTLMEVPPEQMFFQVTEQSGYLGVPTFIQALIGVEYAARVRESATKTVRESTMDRDTLMRLVANDVEQIYTANMSDDLLQVSQKFYNTPHEWRRIMLFNELRTPQLAPGQIVLIPRLAAGDV